MKLKLLYTVSVLLLITFYSCSKKDDNNPSSPQPVGNVSTFYPGNTGSSFSYSIAINNVQAGNRIVTLGGTTTIKGRTYSIQNNFIQLGTDTASAVTFFRMSTDTLFYYIDTTGLYRFIPANLQSSVIIRATDEVKVLGVPLKSGNSWKAYTLTLALGPFSLPVVQLNASYLGQENINLNIANSGQQSKTAEKIQYQMILTIPDSSGNLNQSTTRTYNAKAWFVDGIGLARLEGNAAVLNALSSTSISFSDTTKTAVQTLNSFTIK